MITVCADRKIVDVDLAVFIEDWDVARVGADLFSVEGNGVAGVERKEWGADFFSGDHFTIGVDFHADEELVAVFGDDW